MLYSRRALRPHIVAGISSPVDLTALMRVYDALVSDQVPYLAVRPMYGLASRMRAYCSARAYAQQTGRRLLVVWEPEDVHMRARPEDLFKAAVQGVGASAGAAALEPLPDGAWGGGMGGA